ncbi:MAG TPA: caspase family protein, partial [Blastocatellia bacterium]|nr:caspase family protein [Blastocatellia bacterium]
ARPFRFSADGRSLIAMADGKVRRWEVETGRELPGTALPTAKDFISAFLSEEGRILAAPSMDSSGVRLWDTTAGRELQPLTFDKDDRLDGQDTIALSPTGNVLATLTESVKASRKSIETTVEIRLWEVATGKKMQSLKVSSRPIQYGARGPSSRLSFSGDGAWLAMRSEALMRIWDVSSGRELKSFAAPRLASSNAADAPYEILANRFVFSPDQHLISIVSEGRKVELVDASTGARLHSLAGHEGAIVGMSFSTDGKFIATSGADNQIKVWDVATGRESKNLSGAATPISDIAFSPDGKSLSVAGHQAVSSWEMITGGVRRGVLLPDEYAQHRQNGMQERGCMLSRDGRFVIAGSNTQPTAKVWEVASGRELPNVSLTQGKQLGNAMFNGDGSVVALVETEVKKPDVPRAQAPAQAPGNMPSLPPGGIVMPDMTKIMEQMQKDPKKIQEQMKKVQEAMKKGDMGAGVAVLESIGVMPPTASANKASNNLRILDVATGRQLQAIPQPSGFFNQMMNASSPMSGSTMSFSPDGRFLASASGISAQIVLRDVSTGQELRSLKTPSMMNVVSSLAWSPDGRRLASAQWGYKGNFTDPNPPDKVSFDDMTFSIKVWDTQTGAELSALAGHNNFINGLAFSRDGRMLASGSWDSTIKLWDLASGSEIRSLKGHTGPIAAVDFSSDGRFVVSGSEDGSVRLWRAQTGELLATLVSLNKGDDWLVVTPDGLFDGSPGGWNQILWRFSPGIYDVSPVEIFFNEYFHPGLLPDIFAGRKIAAATDISLKDRRQPKLSLETAAQQGAAVSTRALKVRINVSEAPAGAQDVRLFRNGSLVKLWRGDVLKGQSGAMLETTISIVAGQNQLTAYAFNRDNVKSSDAKLTITGANSLKRGGTLHLLAVGVNQYANAGYNLKYAGADAGAFTEEVDRQQRKLGGFGQIEITTLFDKDATKANILYALRRLAGSPDAKPPAGAPVALEKIKAAEPEDAVVVFYAGHGTAQDQRFYLIPHDLGYTGVRTELDQAGLNSILSHSVSDLELEAACEGIDAGHLLMVIDACNSGQALEAEEKRRGPMNSKGLAQLAYEKGMYILTAAQSYQAAMEAEQLGHGYLTYALVEEGLKSAAADDQPKDGQVVLREWLDYATERVPRMQETKMRAGRGLQHQVAFVEGEEKVEEVDKRSLQRPRVFYRREPDAQPMVVAKP